MDTLRRILSYSRHLNSRIVFFFLFMVLGIVFGAFNLVLIIPMLEVLFSSATTTNVTVPPLPDFSFSSDFVLQTFNHHFLQIIHDSGRKAALLFICLLILSCVLLANLFRYLERVIATKIRVDLTRKLRLHFFERVSQLHLGYFNTQRKGDLIARFTGDAMEVEGAVLNLFKAVIKDPITILVYFGMLFVLSPKLTLFTLIVLPITGAFLARIVNRLKRQAILSQESLGRMVNILEETFGGMRVVKAFNARGFMLSRLENEAGHYRKVNKSMAYRNEMAGPVSEILGVGIVAIIIYFGGSLVLDGSGFKPSEFMGFLALFTMVIQPAKSFSNGITQLQKGIASARRIFSLIDTPSDITSKPDAREVTSFSSSIEFRGVWFAYQTEWVLKDINLIIPKGKTIALVGASGGGKSTLADLVPRFYDPVKGDVLLDGVSLRDLKLESLRNLIGVVTQEPILFHDTIFNNIAFGLPGATEEAVIEAARVANAHEFIMKTEQGYQTVIGERGSRLSGGQRQRISIARAVLKNPPILILDEATSALDNESERLVQEALFRLMTGHTSLVIAHRLSTIQHADEIVVIQDGIIAERGTHQELIGRNGVYRHLSEAQKVS